VFDGTEFLDLAEALLRQESADEARQRSAISRAYYAAFLRTRAHLVARGFRIRHRETHQGVWNLMLKTRNPDAQAIGHAGMQLKALRRAADYEIPYPADLATDAAVAVGRARALLANLQSLT
jgi:uncharacterized protein (UPF0332 family)